MADDNRIRLIDAENVSRREILSAVGVAGAAGLAGCSGGGDGGDGGGGDGGSGDGGGGDGGSGDGGGGDGGSGDGGGDSNLVDPILDGISSRNNLENVSWNRFSPGSPDWGRLSPYFFDYVIHYHPGLDEWMNFLAEDFVYNEGDPSFDLTFKDTGWYDGTPVRAKDLKARWDLIRWTEGETSPPWNFIDSLEIQGEKELHIKLKQKLNPKIFLNSAFNRDPMDTKYEVYQEWIEQFQDATSQSEKDSIFNELTNTTDIEPYSNSLLYPTEISSQEMMCEPNENYYNYGNTNIEQYRFTATSAKPEVMHQELTSGDIDFAFRIFNPSESVLNAIPGEATFAKFPFGNGHGLSFNRDTLEVFNDYRVRQALAYAINFQKVADALMIYDPVESNFCGLSNYYYKKYLSDDFLNQLNDYFEFQPDKAESLLEEAGFSKKGGTWMMPNGKPFKFTVKTIPPRVPDTQVAADGWAKIGVDANIKTLEPATLYGKAVPNGDFQACLWSSIGWRQFHPYADYRDTWTSMPWVTGANVEQTPEVPWPPGDPSGTKKFDVQAKLDELLSATGDKQTQLIQEFAWVYNKSMPQIRVNEKHMLSMFTRDDWDVPKGDDKKLIVDNPTTYAPKAGILNGKTK